MSAAAHRAQDLYDVNDALRGALAALGVTEPTDPGPDQDAYEALVDGLTHTVADTVSAWRCPPSPTG